MPVLLIAYVLAYLDRTNIALAKTHLEIDLGVSAAAYGLGAGLFFVFYCVLEIPSNIIMHRVGPRRWIGRIIITWGAISTLTLFIQGEVSFYIMRILLGIAEAGFYPGMLFLFTLWFAPRDRAIAVGALLLAPQLATIFGSPAFEPIIGATVRELTAMAPDLVVPGHCTGWRAQHALAATLPDAWAAGSSGSTFRLAAA